MAEVQEYTTRPDQERLLYNKGDSAFALGISQRKLEMLIAEKLIAVRRIGSRVLITREELRRFAARG